MYDSFIDGKLEAQLKCLGSTGMMYVPGREVPVKKLGYPSSCTFADWGGTCKIYTDRNLMGENESMGTFVVIENGKFKEITYDENKINYPLFTKYGYLLAVDACGV